MRWMLNDIKSSYVITVVKYQLIAKFIDHIFSSFKIILDRIQLLDILVK